MAINRRRFLGLIAATPWLVSQGARGSSAMPLFSAASKRDDGYYLELFSAAGQLQQRHRLPDRAHQTLFHPTRPWLLAIARRPGTFISVLDYRTGKAVASLQCQPGYHLFGHAQITRDGRYLLTCERNPAFQEGRIVVRDIQHNWQPVREFSCAGIGPHEFKLSPDDSTLVIANGGILTTGREATNLDTMIPSLAYVSLQTGALQEQITLPQAHHQCSIRHLDIAPNGQVLVAMQYQGHLADKVPLVASHRRGEALTPLTLPETTRSRLHQYCGSACFDRSGRYGAISAPRGDQIMLFDMQSLQFIGTTTAKDGCGLAPSAQAGHFIISTGRGRVYRLNAQTQTKERINFQTDTPAGWDNHLSALLSI